MLKYNRDFALEDTPQWYDVYGSYSIEGGGVLVLSKDIVAIGYSQRTTIAGIEAFAENLLKNSSFKKVLVFDIPKCRAFMHLDTVFTMVDYDKFTIHPEIEGPLGVYEITLGENGEMKYNAMKDELSKVLALELNLPAVDLIRCGGGDLIAAQREQWNDGSNTLCIAPGTVVTYERNYVTNDLLDKKGIKVLSIPSAELSRGRGGLDVCPARSTETIYNQQGEGEHKMAEKIVVALGGNALQSGKAEPTAEAQLAVVKETCERIADLSEKGYEVAVVHGNGPQVGRILLASETAKNVTPAMPFDVCGVMSQGYIGYHLQQALKFALKKRGREIPGATILTQMVVDAQDPGFKNPTKPIGPFYSEEEAKALVAEKGYTVKEDAGRGWRRVVASPIPTEIVELDSVKRLFDSTIVITCGGGGIRSFARKTVIWKVSQRLSIRTLRQSCSQKTSVRMH